MDTEFDGPSLPPHLVQLYELKAHLDVDSDNESENFLTQKSKPKKHSDKRKHIFR